MQDLIDNTRVVETPEGVLFDYRPAGLPIRAWACLIDTLIRLGIYLALLFVSLFLSGFLGDLAVGIGLICLFLVEWGYPVFFEVKYRGQTPGKKIMGLHVIHSDGTPVQFQASLIRNLLLFIDGFTSFYFFGILSMSIDKNFRRFGDLAGGTLVCHKEDSRRKELLPKVQPARVPVPLTLEEQRAIIAFAVRSRYLSQARQDELAEILRPLHFEKKKEAVKRIHAYAATLAGKS